MKKFSKDQKDQLISLMLYNLFRKPEGLDAYCIASQICTIESDRSESEPQSNEVYDVMKDWIELGCKVNFCWLEGKADLSTLILSPHEFERLRFENQDLHKTIQPLRIKASKRWSNDWIRIQPKIVAARGLYEIGPKQDSLILTWKSVQADCARKLQQMNKPTEAEYLQRLSFENLAIRCTEN